MKKIWEKYAEVWFGLIILAVSAPLILKSIRDQENRPVIVSPALAAAPNWRTRTNLAVRSQWTSNAVEVYFLSGNELLGYLEAENGRITKETVEIPELMKSDFFNEKAKSILRNSTP